MNIRIKLSKINLVFYLILNSIVIFYIAEASENFVALIDKRLSKNGTVLDLGGLKIGISGAKKLAKMEKLTKVKVLLLQGNKIQYKGMKALAKSSFVKNVKQLDFVRV